MIKISLDESQIFDMLSIINVKINNSVGITKEKNIDNFQNLSVEIRDSIGKVKFNDILQSDEYKELYDCNSQLFKLIDDIKEKPNTIFFDVADNLNLDRYKLKQKLQKKFFNEELKEIKMGYD